MDLHAESGQLALREAGLEAQFKALARYDDQYDAIYEHHSTFHFEHSEATGVDRHLSRSQ